MPFRSLAAAVVLALALPACGGIVDPSTNNVIPFTGTFDVGGGGQQHLFSASKRGEFFITLTTLTPDATAAVGVNLSQQTGGGCALVSTVPGVVGRQAYSGPLDKGNYCVQVFDAGLSTLSGPQSYTLRVSVP